MYHISLLSGSLGLSLSVSILSPTMTIYHHKRRGGRPKHLYLRGDQLDREIDPGRRVPNGH